MLAWFYKGEFFGMWQDQSHEDKWVERTAISLGHKINDVEVYRCPALRNDESHYFDEQKRLVLGSKSTVVVDGQPQTVFEWGAPQELERFYPL